MAAKKDPPVDPFVEPSKISITPNIVKEMSVNEDVIVKLQNIKKVDLLAKNYKVPVEKLQETVSTIQKWLRARKGRDGRLVKIEKQNEIRRKEKEKKARFERGETAQQMLTEQFTDMDYSALKIQNQWRAKKGREVVADKREKILQKEVKETVNYCCNMALYISMMTAAMRIQEFMKTAAAKNKSSRIIGRVYRGRLGRKRFSIIQHEKFINDMATKIQNAWRDYISRKLANAARQIGVGVFLERYLKRTFVERGIKGLQELYFPLYIAVRGENRGRNELDWIICKSNSSFRTIRRILRDQAPQYNSMNYSFVLDGKLIPWKEEVTIDVTESVPVLWLQPSSEPQKTQLEDLKYTLRVFLEGKKEVPIGFVMVDMLTSLHEARKMIEAQLGDGSLPSNFRFVVSRTVITLDEEPYVSAINHWRKLIVRPYDIPRQNSLAKPMKEKETYMLFVHKVGAKLPIGFVKINDSSSLADVRDLIYRWLDDPPEDFRFVHDHLHIQARQENFMKATDFYPKVLIHEVVEDEPIKIKTKSPLGKKYKGSEMFGDLPDTTVEGKIHRRGVKRYVEVPPKEVSPSKVKAKLEKDLLRIATSKKFILPNQSSMIKDDLLPAKLTRLSYKHEWLMGRWARLAGAYHKKRKYMAQYHQKPAAEVKRKLENAEKKEKKMFFVETNRFRDLAKRYAQLRSRKTAVTDEERKAKEEMEEMLASEEAVITQRKLFAPPKYGAALTKTLLRPTTPHKEKKEVTTGGYGVCAEEGQDLIYFEEQNLYPQGRPTPHHQTMKLPPPRPAAPGYIKLPNELCPPNHSGIVPMRSMVALGQVATTEKTPKISVDRTV